MLPPSRCVKHYTGRSVYEFKKNLIAKRQTPMSWDDAQKYCRANNTDLVTVENETVNSELLKISENRSWIGLRHETNHWYWSNGDPVAYTNWTHKFSCAVFQTDGSWNDSDCNQQKPFMCYKDQSWEIPPGPLNDTSGTEPMEEDLAGSGPCDITFGLYG
ncbi:FREM1 protein, partial [Polypterus senegalus]